MIKNYLKSAWRNIARHKFISFINIFGLTIGITCCLLILTYIINETSYDKYNTNADRTYRVTRIFYDGNGNESLHLSAIAPPFGPLLKTAFPEVQQMTRVLPSGTVILRYKEKMFNEQNAFFADEHFFDIFSVDVTHGDKRTALNDPYTVMLTQSVAHKYFGDDDPINKTIILDNSKHEFKVTGIFKPFPMNAHMHPNILMSFNTLKDPAVMGEKELENDYGGNAFYTFLLLPKDYNADKLRGRLPSFLDNYVHMQGMAANAKTSKFVTLTLQKLTDIHLRSHLDDEVESNGDISRVYIFSVIALFILLIACINYMNLSTARSALRAKEIGIRKVIGAQRKEIIRQFLSESVLVTWIALILAIVLTSVLLPYVDKLSNLNLKLSELYSWDIFLALFALPFVVGIISGIYPALFMSWFKPVKVLKGLFKAGSGGVSFRKVLVVTQFAISIVLIVATTVVFQQLHFIEQKSLGFNKDHVLTMAYNSDLTKPYDSFRNDLLKIPGVKELGRSSRTPSGRLLDDQGASVMQNGVLQQVKIDLKCLTTDYGFIPTYGMHMAAGRNFSRDFATDTASYILNETAVKMLGWGDAQNAIDKDMVYGGTKGKVIGVVSDFHFESLHQKIVPMIFYMPAGSYYHSLSINISSNNIQATLTGIQNIWHRYLPNVPFDYTFLDLKFQQLYNSEQEQGSLFTIFSCIAIFIACLGLFGLSAFTITQRVKEIGVRKVLGASVSQIVTELSKDFLKLVLFAMPIAWLCSWWATNQWLQGFAYRINVNYWIFILAGILALIIAFVTISFQSIKAANANPVKSLRSE